MTRLGWHIVDRDRELGFADGRKVRVGVRMRFRPTSEGFNYKEDRKLLPDEACICMQGMHASPTMADAWRCWQIIRCWEIGESWLCRVQVEGTGRAEHLSKCGFDADGKKFVGTHRTVLGMIPVDEARSWDWNRRKILNLMRARNRRNGTRIEVR